MSCYIYLNEYANGYLYVGSHVWKGPRGQIDPDYQGSSVLARKYHWKPVNITILEDATDKRK